MGEAEKKRPSCFELPRFAMAGKPALVAASTSPPAPVVAPPASPPAPVAALPAPPHPDRLPLAEVQTALLNMQSVASNLLIVPGALIDIPPALNLVVEALLKVVAMLQRGTVAASLRAATTGLTYVGSSLQLCLQSGAVTYHDKVVAAALKAAVASFIAASAALVVEGADAMIIAIGLQNVAALFNSLDFP